MNKEEYESKKNELESDVDTETMIKEAKVLDRSGKEIPDDILNMVDKSKELMDDYEEREEEERQEELREEEVDDPVSNMTRQEIEDLPDFGDFLKTEEFIRMGTDTRIPYVVEIGGKKFKVYIRPLSANEFYNLQRKVINKNQDMNFLAVKKACTDTKGDPLPARLIDKIGFNVVQNIGDAIFMASGVKKDDSVTEQLVENLLED
ncbi:MAG: hypothetical protein LUC37_06590 [Prevotella sp.]|nr:hypothetical protein [Prevotella sp.]